MRRPVIAGYDGSRAGRRALARAAEAALGGRVVVVTAVPPEDEAALVGAAEPLVGEPARLFEEAATLLRGYDLEVSMRIEQADPAEALATVARDENAELIVVGARGDNYLARALRGSVGERLVARAPCDLLVAR